MSPVWVRSSASASLARPKSVTQSVPRTSSRRLDGLTSRWSTPWLCGVVERLGRLDARAGPRVRAYRRPECAGAAERTRAFESRPGRARRPSAATARARPPGSAPVGDDGVGRAPVAGDGRRERPVPRASGRRRRPSATAVGSAASGQPAGPRAAPAARRSRRSSSSTSLSALARDELHHVVVSAALAGRRRRPARCWCGAAAPRPAPRARTVGPAAGVGQGCGGRTFSATRRPSDSCSAS